MFVHRVRCLAYSDRFSSDDDELLSTALLRVRRFAFFALCVMGSVVGASDMALAGPLSEDVIRRWVRPGGCRGCGLDKMLSTGRSVAALRNDIVLHGVRKSFCHGLSRCAVRRLDSMQEITAVDILLFAG